MVIIAVFCGVLSILISCIAVYQSEHFNKLSRELNKDTKLMIDCNEKSINNLHSTLDEIINKEETKLETKEEQVTFIKNEMVLIKMNNYNLENKFNILHSIMYLSNILASKSISDLDMWLDNDEQKVILKIPVKAEEGWILRRQKVRNVGGTLRTFDSLCVLFFLLPVCGFT